MLPALTPARAAGPACAGWLTILTVGGLVGASNRGPFDPERDRLLNHNNLSFQKARAFSAGELAGLPQKTVTANSYGRDMAASGPLLHDVLAVAAPEAAAKTARLSALDGFAAEIALSDVEGHSGSSRWKQTARVWPSARSAPSMRCASLGRTKENGGRGGEVGPFPLLHRADALTCFVIPCALQRETVHCRYGIVANAGPFKIPDAAQALFRDDVSVPRRIDASGADEIPSKDGRRP